MAKLNKLLLTAAMLLAAAALVGVGASSALAQSTLQKLKDQGYARAGFANEAPFGYAGPGGKLTGESPEIAKAIFKRIGVPEVDGVLTEWASLIPGLQAGRFDVIAAGMFVTPKRCEQVAFSNPTYKLGQSFLVAAGNPHNLHSYEDVADNSDVKLGVMAGAVEAGYARKAGIPDDRIVQLPDQASLLAAVKSGRVDAGALTYLSIQSMAEKGGSEVEQAKPFHTPPEFAGYGAFAFRKDDTALLKAFNRELKTFVGSKEHLDLVGPFGWTKEMMPEKDMTAEKLCNR